MKLRLFLVAALAACSMAPAWAAPLAAATEAPAADAKALWGNGKDSCRELPPATATRLGVIRQMLAAGKPHAAIAYLDAARIEAPQADLLRAEGLRQTGRTEEAGRIYRKLLPSCVAGYAYQGLGLISSQAGQAQQAVAHLKAAAAALPVDPAVRNDYGYALLMAGDHAQALHEFLTAIELAPNQRRAAHNLLLLLARTGEDEKARAFAEQFGISAEELVGVRQLAAPLADTASAGQPPIGMSDPLTRDQPGDEPFTHRNDTGAHDEADKQLADGIVAGRRDSVR